MKTFKLKLLALLYIFCLLTNGLTASLFNDIKGRECNYLAPSQPILDEAFFYELIVRSNNENMMLFIENEDVDAIYQQLSEY